MLKQDDANQAARQIALTEARIVKLERDIKDLAPANGAVAPADVPKMQTLGKEAMTLKAALPAKRDQLAEYQQAFAGLNEIVGRMEAKKREMEDQRATIA